MDKDLKAIQEWLNIPADSRDMTAGANILYKINKNRILQQNILRNPKAMHPKLEYELKKYLRIFLDGQTQRGVRIMEKKVMATVKSSLKAAPQSDPLHRGKRADHNLLPTDIQELPAKNTILFHKIKKVYNELLQMSDQAPCDRYERLKILDELDKTWRDNWNRYDNYKVEQTQMAEPASFISAKEVSAARKFISANSKKLLSMEDPAKTELLSKIQVRIDIVIKSGGSFKNSEYLESLGLTVRR